ncbi:hypothetical protein Dred_3229 [Desulforamulus reducens MI-1]|uniref:Uncharacterized protein n=1 Tax=Desulforamulus reducens (strain ATCC BAA-1160 / DSM 100696 / MI-1) TaxID=349161 RepID=A4J9H8_DESRM|nr:hypothetical protein [Desulforamulus reducens]ABO51731.1 hypothetical protein Dred_3229 [Desulforamulus reducens MI-1]
MATTCYGIISLYNAIKNQVEHDCALFIQKMQEEFKTDCIDITKYTLAKWRHELQDKVDQEEFIQNATIIVMWMYTFITLGKGLRKLLSAKL